MREGRGGTPREGGREGELREGGGYWCSLKERHGNPILGDGSASHFDFE